MAAEREPGPAERAATAGGKSAAEVAALDRFFAGLRELCVARFNLEVSAESANRSLNNLVTAMRDLDERLAATASAEIAAHPDLTYFNAQMDGYYN